MTHWPNTAYEEAEQAIRNHHPCGAPYLEVAVIPPFDIGMDDADVTAPCTRTARTRVHYDRQGRVDTLLTINELADAIREQRRFFNVIESAKERP